MAHGLNGGNQPFFASGAQLEHTGAEEAGRNHRASLSTIETAEIGHFAFAPVGFDNWSKTGADWSSKGAAAPVVYTPLKGGYNPNWSIAPVRLQTGADQENGR